MIIIPFVARLSWSLCGLQRHSDTQRITVYTTLTSGFRECNKDCTIFSQWDFIYLSVCWETLPISSTLVNWKDQFFTSTPVTPRHQYALHNLLPWDSGGINVIFRWVPYLSFTMASLRTLGTYVGILGSLLSKEIFNLLWHIRIDLVLGERSCVSSLQAKRNESIGEYGVPNGRTRAGGSSGRRQAAARVAKLPQPAADDRLDEAMFPSQDVLASRYK